MKSNNSREREAPSISAGSMADVAFLLLIFFLVVTTIDVDKGIQVLLPPWCEGPECSTMTSDDRVLAVALNMNDQLLVEQREMPIQQLRSKTKEFIRTRNQEGKSPAVISLVNDRSTSYESYVKVYNELRAAYNELWEEEAQAQYAKAYTFLEKDEQIIIRKRFPLVISEAEPTDFAVN